MFLEDIHKHFECNYNISLKLANCKFYSNSIKFIDGIKDNVWDNNSNQYKLAVFLDR
jgi:hypothetical protein